MRKPRRVAPFTGAWIETAVIGRDRGWWTVAPFTGAWIETPLNEALRAAYIGRPLHGGVD